MLDPFQNVFIPTSSVVWQAAMENYAFLWKLDTYPAPHDKKQQLGTRITRFQVWRDDEQDDT